VRVGVTAGHRKQAQELVDETHAKGGLAPVDIDLFWEQHDAAMRDIWSSEIPQAPFGAFCSCDCVEDELGKPVDWNRYWTDAEHRALVNTEYNDKAERIVGRRILDETIPKEVGIEAPTVRSIQDLFELKGTHSEDSKTTWLMPSAQNEAELAALLDRVDARLDNLRDFMLADDWDEKNAGWLTAGMDPLRLGWLRGPVTFACSLYGVENLIFLILDNPNLAGRLRDMLLRALLDTGRMLDEEGGLAPDDRPRGFHFSDDNCCMLNAEMYEFFALPIVKGVWDYYSPDPGDTRSQHSDSDMAHIMPLLARCDLTWANFGPTVMVDEIRRQLPRAEIHGALAPFTFSYNDEVGMVAEFLRDFERMGDERGWIFAAAGSTNSGSRLTGMRLMMAAVQRFGQYR